MSVIELGCGAGHYALYYHDKCKEYVGVDITPENIDILNDKVKASGIRNVTGRIGDATKLDFLVDESFDVVLCLGPMYHLPPDERELVFDECRRICKSGGIAAFAYINRVGVYAGACVTTSYANFIRAIRLTSGFYKKVETISIPSFFSTRCRKKSRL